MRVSKKPDERRQEIVAAAMELFTKQGYEKTSVEDITNAIKVAKGSFYNYFKSKREVFEVCITAKTEFIMSEYEHILACKDKTPIERLRDYIEYNFMLAEKGDNAGLYKNIHSPEFEFFHQKAQIEGIYRILPVFIDLIDEGKKNCGFKIDDSEFTASVLLGALREAHNLLSARNEESADHHRALVYGLIKQILGVDIR